MDRITRVPKSVLCYLKTRVIIFSQLSRCSKARGSSSGFSLGGSTKVKACKSFLFTQGSLKVENK